MSELADDKTKAAGDNIGYIINIGISLAGYHMLLMQLEPVDPTIVNT